MIKRIALTLAAILLAASPAAALNTQASRAIRTSAWMPITPPVIVDCVSGPVAPLTITRASTAWQDNPDGSWTQFGSGVLRRTGRGCLVEENRTNKIRNNTMTGASVGSYPTSKPTNWGQNPVAGLTAQITAIGTDGGVNYIDLQFNGTPTATGAYSIYFDTNTGIPAANGQAWTLSAFTKLAAGSLTNVGTIGFNCSVQNSGGTFSSNLIVGTPVKTSAGALGLQRTAVTATIADANAAFVLPSISFAFTNGQAVNFTLRIGWPQLEQEASVSSPIPTSTVAVTRPADQVSLTTIPTMTNTYSWAASGVYSWPNSQNFPTTVDLEFGTVSNRESILVNQPGGKLFQVGWSGGTSGGLGLSYDFATGLYPLQTGLATARDANNNQQWISGGVISTGVAWQTPRLWAAPLSKLTIGAITGSYMNGYVRRVWLWPNLVLTRDQLRTVGRLVR